MVSSFFCNRKIAFALIRIWNYIQYLNLNNFKDLILVENSLLHSMLMQQNAGQAPPNLYCYHGTVRKITTAFCVLYYCQGFRLFTNVFNVYYSIIADFLIEIRHAIHF